MNLLKSVDGNAARHLAALLHMKTRAGYGFDPVTPDQLKRATRAMDTLIERAKA
ncbi:hypothetical protein [Arthrobacter sp. fls2-241-R2A-172]|uniref:hypothetical protein n=1 Tax=Arthrobacter sp. fls2-241-R2A-172 TaxID=3040325 RepID=UPI00254B3DE5|nr:hypothetical protein [Arthrobacter sp. fls2-241-R2A-172]